MASLGISFGRWTHSCWTWLHHCSISKDVLDLLPLVLPCSICSQHFLRYRTEHPVYEPISRWLVDLHNDINVRTGKPVVSYADADTIPPRDARMEFVNFLFAAVFVVPLDHVRIFCTVAFPTVGIHSYLPRDGRDEQLARILFDHLRPYGYTCFEDLVVDFVPVHMHKRYGLSIHTEGKGRQLAPCSGDMLTYATQSIVQEESGIYTHIRDRMNHPKALAIRIQYFCDTLVVPTYAELPLLVPCPSTMCLTDCIVRYLRPTSVMSIGVPVGILVCIVILLLVLGRTSKLRGFKNPWTLF
jgi:hypothetical protein